MALQFKTFKSPIKAKDGKKKYYPRIITVGKIITTRMLAEEVSKRTSLSMGDAISALFAVPEVMRIFMSSGYSVKLDGLGSFRITCKASGTGVDTPEEVGPAQITALKVMFTPEYTYNPAQGRTRALFAGLSFERYGSKLKSLPNGNNAGNDDENEDDPTA